MVDLVCIDPARVREIWPQVAPFLKSAIVGPGISAWSDLEEDVLEGDGLLWICREDNKILCAGTTALQGTDSGLVCVVTACGGTDMRSWLPLLAKIEAYAKAEGCRCTRIVGRKGWIRVLEGYTVSNVILEKKFV